MSNQGYEFRSAAIGGFHREDVTNYIKTITEEHRQRIQQLEDQLAELVAQRDSQNQMLEEARDAMARLAIAQEELTDQREENRMLKEELSRLQEAESALQEKLDVWAPSVTTYGAIKSQMAEIELDARERSAILLQRAEDQAAQQRRKSAQVMRQAAEDYEQTRKATNQTLNDLVSQLRCIQGQLQDLCGTLDGDGKTLFEMSEKAEADTNE